MPRRSSIRHPPFIHPSPTTMKKLPIPYPIIVEGKYDKIRLASLIDAPIFPCDGFGVFRKEEKIALFRRLCAKGKVIVLTDADGGGKVIRAHLRSVLPKESVIHLYIPAVPGKEKRKDHPGKEGLLGVEGIDSARLLSIFKPFSSDSEVKLPSLPPLTKTDLYFDGLSGGKGAAEKRKSICRALSLPPNLSADAMLEAINLLSLQEDYRAALAALPE